MKAGVWSFFDPRRLMMLTEKDEFIYHEMITHVPMAVHPKSKKILVIGAGDGGCLRELIGYPEVEHIDLCEIDRPVIEVCRECLPQTVLRFNDPRAFDSLLRRT